jgi:flagellar hook assembly protein FlgD
MCYSIPRECNVTLSIYDITGKLVKILVNELKNSGVYSVNWNGTDDRGRKVGQGVYFYTLETSIQTFTKKLVLMK